MSTPAPSTDGHGQDRSSTDAWTEHVQRMDTADLRLLAVSLPLIEQAKGILMGHYGCDATTAFTILRRWSSAHGLKLRDVAGALVDEAARDGLGRGAAQRPSAVERFLSNLRPG